MQLTLIQAAKNLIREVPDFPKKGISFKDIAPLLASPIFNEIIDEMAQRSKQVGAITHIAGIESRGFVVGMALASRMHLPFVMIRKAGKLPPPTIQKAIVTEYSTDILEMAPGNGSLLLVDDVFALGGTMKAAYELSMDAGYKVAGMMAMIDLAYLQRTFNTIGEIDVITFIPY